MCGIAGLLSFDSSAKSAEFSSAIREMTSLMVRRGPDDESFWDDPEGRLRLGFRRLSILDLSSAGRQPMVSASGRSVLVFNGEIYNYRELKTELESKGLRFRSKTDSEVLLEALEFWGEDKTLQKLNGMFAFGWYSLADRKLILARDHAGIKPLYYYVNAEKKGIAFASQLNALLRTPWGKPGPVDLSVLHLYLKLHHIPAPYGFYKNTFQLEAGHYLIIHSTGLLENKTWWSLPRNPEPEIFGQKALSAAEESIYNAVKRQKIADVPLGVFLSGGIDSPLVAANLQSVTEEKVKAFTVSNPGWAQDETKDAENYARALGLEHHIQIISNGAEDLIKSSEEARCGEPFGDFSIVPSLLISRFSKNKITAALSGDGGDELFFGYERPLSLLKDGRLFGLPHILRMALYGAGKYGLGPKVSDTVVFKTAGDYYMDVNSRFKEADIQSLFPGLPPLPESFQLYESGPYKGTRGLANYSRYAEYYGQMQRCLKKVDMASMYNSQEVRVPLLDREVVETSLRIDPMTCMENGGRKTVLRKLLAKKVPENLISKDKRGFAFPAGEVFKKSSGISFEPGNPAAGMIDSKKAREFLERHQSGKEDLKWALWTLYSLKGVRG